MPLKKRGFFADFYVSSISFGYWTGRKLSSSSFELKLCADECMCFGMITFN